MISKTAGYKKSILGDIPDNWQVKSLGEIFEFKNGLNKEKKYFGSGTPIVNYVDVYNNRQINGDELQGTVQVTDSEKERFNVQNGDVFFTRTSETIDEIGYSSVAMNVDPGTVFSGFVLRAREKQTTLDNLYKKYCFSTYLSRKEIITKSSMTTRALTSGTLLSGVNVIIPPLEEQKKIAKILSTWDRAIELKEEELKIEKSLLLQAINTFTKSNNFIRSSYESIPIDKCSNFINGYAFHSSNYSDKGNYYIVTIGNVQNGTLDLHEKTKKVKEIPSNINNNQILSKNDILISMTGNVGRACMVQSDNLLLNQRVGKLVPSKSVDNNYFYFALRSSRFLFKMIAKAQGGAQPNLSTKDIKKHYIEFPDINTQVMVGKYLQSLDKKITLRFKEIKELQKQKQGLMQQLLTGKIRVQR